MTSLLLAAVAFVEDTPQKTIEGFVKAFNAHEAAGLSRRVVGQGRGNMPMGSGMPTLRAVIGKASINGDKASVQVDAELSDSGRSFQKVHETVRLRRVGGDWRIVPADPNLDSRMSGQLVGGLAYVATNRDIFMKAKQSAKRTMCLSNVKQLALGTLLYASDHGDVLPKTSAGWKAAIMPYVKNEKLFRCPDDPSGKDGYFLDPRIAGKPMSAIAQPALTAMVVEGTPKQSAFRHAGRANLGYVDGHAKLVDRAAVAKARTLPLK